MNLNTGSKNARPNSERRMSNSSEKLPSASSRRKPCVSVRNAFEHSLRVPET